MERIWFRGMGVTTKEWHYGYVFQGGYKDGDGVFIRSTKVADSAGHLHDVFEGSVGQFTGRYDRNGYLIFEGDYVDARCEDGSVFHYVVEYDDDAASFVLRERVLCVDGRLCPGVGDRFGDFTDGMLEVVGKSWKEELEDE